MNTNTKPATIEALSPRTIGLMNAKDVDSIDVQDVGGKGLGLIKMAAAGLPVPDGFCVTASAYWAFMSQSGIQADIEKAAADGDTIDFQTIADRIKSEVMPEELITELAAAYKALDAEYVAVRSSGVEEDSAEHSFAGQHDTFLYVANQDDLITKVKECWASLWNASAMAYRDQKSSDDGIRLPSAMGVVVQMMITGEASGVAFGQLPMSGETDKFLIEACFGLGEGLVSGRLTADSYVVGKQDFNILDTRVEYKLIELVYDGSSVGERKVAEDIREESVLSSTDIQALVKHLQTIESYFGSAQDVEWTKADGQFFMLQSRPITQVLPLATDDGRLYLGNEGQEVEDNILWSRMDIGEIFTGRLTPLGVSFAKYYQYNVHGDCGVILGLYDLGSDDDFMAYYKGHVYLNVAYAAYWLSQTPIGKDQVPFLERFTSEEVDLTGYVNPYGEAFQSDKGSSGKFTRYWLKKNIKEFFVAKRRAEKMVGTRYIEYDRAINMDLTNMDFKQLGKEMAHALDYFKAMHTGYLPFYINAFGFYGALEELCGHWLGDRGKHLQNRLKGDMSNLRTVEAARDVWALCQKVKHFPELYRVFLKEEPGIIVDYIANNDDGVLFERKALRPFMRENGVRAREEMELVNPRWVDDPTYVITMIKTYLQQGYEVDNKLQYSGEENSAYSDQLLNQLPFLKRRVLKLVIKLYCKFSRLREETRMSMITSIWLVRRIVYEVANRLVAQGLLSSVDDVKYLAFDDIMQYIYEYKPAAELFSAQKIEAVKREYQAILKQPEPPLTFVGYGNTAKPLSIPDAGDGLVGLGTSPGQVTARARVIHDLVRQANEIEKGEIIVTEFTDASWTPLFALAGGVVTDIGSMLSHSSIVAREFGIPSVVNCKVATAVIRTGDLLTIDGQTGHIVIEQEPQDQSLAEEQEAV